MKPVIRLSCTLLLSACASGGLTGRFPPPQDPQHSAEITVLRNRNPYGIAIAAHVMYDGFEIARLGPGQYVTFYADPGTHAVGLKEVSITLPFEAGKRYYFLSTMSASSGKEIERITEEQAHERLAGSTRITQ